MKNFIKHYALEVYTVLAMLLLLVGGLIGDLTVIQKNIPWPILFFSYCTNGKRGIAQAGSLT